MATFNGTATMFDVHPKHFGDAIIDYSLTPEIWLWTGPDPQQSWAVASEINNEIPRANGYAPAPLANHVWAQTGATAKLDSDPVEFVAAGGPIDAKGYILVLRNGPDSNSPVIDWGYLDAVGQDEKSVSPPDLIRLTPNAANGWYITSNV